MVSASKKLVVVALGSTETEIVEDGERFPTFSWFRYFLLAQSDITKEDVLMQDNESTISIRRHHPCSMGKGSKHENVRCFIAVVNMNHK